MNVKYAAIFHFRFSFDWFTSSKRNIMKRHGLFLDRAHTLTTPHRWREGKRIKCKQRY